MIRLSFVMILAASIAGGCSYLNRKVGLDDDNLIEEVIELGIEHQTGLDVDLSPDSKE